jgi:membrane protease YdiL (CAAX protease family)
MGASAIHGIGGVAQYLGGAQSTGFSNFGYGSVSTLLGEARGRIKKFAPRCRIGSKKHVLVSKAATRGFTMNTVTHPITVRAAIGTVPGSSMRALEPGSLASRVRLADIVWLVFVAFGTANLADVFLSMAHGSRFVKVVAAVSVCNIWYLAGYAWLSPRRGWVDLRQRFAPIDHRGLVGCAAAGATLVFGFIGLVELLEWGGIKLADLSSPLLGLSHLSQLPAAVITIAIIGPLGEELLFRGLLLDWLRRKMRTWVAVVIVSVLFSLAHGIAIKSGLAGCLQCADRVLMGIIAAALTVRFQSLRPSFVFHATINLIGVIGIVLESHA